MLLNHAESAGVNEAKAFLQTVKNADFVTEIEGKIVQASKLLPGQPAIDFEMLCSIFTVLLDIYLEKANIKGENAQGPGN